MSRDTAIFAIDPGCEQSAWVLYTDGMVWNHGKQPNDVVLQTVEQLTDGIVVIEQIESFGMPVGREVFETVFWAGRFAQACPARVKWERLPRKAVKLHLCQSVRANDATIRQALIDRFGGKDEAIGSRANQGPLYGITADRWSALALAVTWADTHEFSDMRKAATR